MSIINDQILSQIGYCFERGYAVTVETAIQDGKECQDFDSQSFVQGEGHSQKVKASPCTNDCGSKGWRYLPSSIAVSTVRVGQNNTLHFSRSTGLPFKYLFKRTKTKLSNQKLAQI